jgi:outer membrane protein assembly factor BamB
MDGGGVWSFDLSERYGKILLNFGITSTPVLDQGRLFLQLIHGDGKAETSESLVIALDAATGRELWKQPRVTGARALCEHSYASPVLFQRSGSNELLTYGADFLIAHDLDTGEERWRYCVNRQGRRYDPSLELRASPVTAPGLVVVPGAKHTELVALTGEGQGDISDAGDCLLWRKQRHGPDMSSPLIANGLVFVVRAGSDMICLDARTGEELFVERTHKSSIRASPVYADGKIYMPHYDGTVTVLRASPRLEVLARNEFREAITSSPAVAGGRLYFRTAKALWAIGKK